MPSPTVRVLVVPCLLALLLSPGAPTACSGASSSDGDATSLFDATDEGSPLDPGGTDQAAPPADVETPDADADTFQPPTECEAGSDCDDQNRCTDELCLEHRCVYSNNARTCDDGDACTQGDSCTGGACVGTPLDCEDANPCTVDACTSGACTHKAVAGDACALRIDLTWPPRGASVTAGGPLTLEGSITSPAAPIEAATLDGVPVEVSAEGAFTVPFDPVAGLNVIRLKVRDGLGREADRVQSFLYAGAFTKPGTPTAPTLLPQALEVWLRYDVFDDDDTSDLDDVATLVRRALDGLDIGAYIPHPLTAEGEGPSALWCTWTIDVSQVSYDVGWVDFFPTDGGLWLSVTLTDFAAYLDAVAPALLCPDAHGWVYADTIGIDAEVKVAVAGSGAISTSVPYVAATVEGIELALDGGFASLFDWLLNWFSDSFSTKIEQAVEDWVPQSLVPLLNGVLGKVVTYQKALDLPGVSGNEPGAPVTAAVRAQAIELSYEGMRLVAKAGAEVAVTPPHDTPGSLARGDCLGADPGAFFLPGWDQVEAAVSEDLLNRALWALWAGGHLNVTLDETLLGDAVKQFNLKELVVTLDPLLPPVVTSCATPGELVAQLGDLQLKAAFDLGGGPGELVLYGTLAVAVTPVLVPGATRNELSLEVGEVRDLGVDVVHAEGTGTALAGLVETLLVDVVRDVVLGTLVKDAIAAWPVPEIDLGAYVPGLPSGSVVTFDPQTLEPVDHGHVLLGGTVMAP